MANVIQPNGQSIKNPELSGSTAPEKKLGWKKPAVIGAIALTLIGGGVSAYKLNQNRQTTTEAPASPNKAPKATTTETATAQENSVEKYNGVMEKYKSMSIEAFDSLPMDERLPYSQYLIDQTISRGSYDTIYGASGNSHENEIKPAKASIENSGQEILDIFLLNKQVSLLQFIESEAQPYDLKDGRKALSSVFYTVGENKVLSNQYVAYKSFQEKLSKPTGIGDKYTCINTSDILAGTDSNGNAVQYKNVSYLNQDKETSCARFIYHEFTNYNDVRIAIWLFDTQANTIEELDKIQI